VSEMQKISPPVSIKVWYLISTIDWCISHTSWLQTMSIVWWEMLFWMYARYFRTHKNLSLQFSFCPWYTRGKHCISWSRAVFYFRCRHFLEVIYSERCPGFVLRGTSENSDSRRTSLQNLPWEDCFVTPSDSYRAVRKFVEWPPAPRVHEMQHAQ
jgi:hypothetical protein